MRSEEEVEAKVYELEQKIENGGDFSLLDDMKSALEWVLEETEELIDQAIFLDRKDVCASEKHETRIRRRGSASPVPTEGN